MVAVVSVTTLHDAAEIGDRLRRNEAVIVNLEAAEHDAATRVFDFTLGLCTGMLADIEPVADDVFLVTPPRVAEGDEEA